MFVLHISVSLSPKPMQDHPLRSNFFLVIFIVISCRFATRFGGIELYILCAMGIGKFVAEIKKLVAILGSPLF